MKESQKPQYQDYIKIATEAYKIGYLEAKKRYSLPVYDIEWKNDYDIYIRDCERVYEKLRMDNKWIEQQSAINPKINVLLTLERAYLNFWGTHTGWEYCKKKKRKTIDWEQTFKNALSNNSNKVWKNTLTQTVRQSSSYNKYNKPQ